MAAVPLRQDPGDAAFRAVFEGALDAMLIADDAGRFVDVNPAACTLFGRTRDKMLALSVFDVSPDPARVRAGWAAFLASGEARAEWRVVRPDGSERWLEGASRANIASGRHLAVLRDVTPQRRAAEQLRRSGEFYSAIFRESPVAMTITAIPDGHILDVNAATLELTGRSRDELVGKTAADVMAWVLPASRTAVADAFTGTRIARNVEMTIRRPTGEPRELLVSTQHLEMRGQPCLIHVVTDVTERRAAERAAEEAQAIGRVGNWAVELPSKKLIWSSEARRIFAMPDATDATLDAWTSRIHSEDRARVTDLAFRTLESGSEWEHRYRVVRDAGEIVWVHGRGRIERDAEGRPVRMVGTVQDVTEQQLATLRLAASERRYRRMLETAPYGILIGDLEARITFANDKLASMLGYPIDQLVGRAFSTLLTDADRPRLDALRARRRAGISETYDVTLVRADGTTFVAELAATPVVDERGHVDGALININDVTLRRQAEELGGRLTAIVQSSYAAITSCDLYGRIQTWNAAAEKLFGYTAAEAIGELFELVVPPEELVSYYESVRNVMYGEVVSLDTRRRRKDGTLIDVALTRSAVHDGSGRIIAISTIARDITDQKRLETSLHQTEQQLQHLQRMEAIGALAGGIAHDFNNILSVIVSSASLIEDALPAGDPMLEDAAAIRDATERATMLTRQLLAFSRRQMLEPRVVNLERVVTGMENMLRRLLGERISLVTVAAGTGNTLLDVSQFEQVVLNLAVNARDAMPDGGELVIECDDVDVDASTAARCGGRPGAHVRITVSDTGVGMDAATQSRIFEPFFTTKEKGKGTGLGLATVFGIVRQSGGFIRFESELGRGTSFEIYLPRTDRSEALVGAGAIPTMRRGRGETILVVEDEEAVRRLVQRVLKREGYEVLTAANAGEALLLCEQHHAHIKLLLTDVVMPIMNGRELAERLVSKYPALRVAFMSGYHDDEQLRELVGTSDVVYMQKPVRRDVLVRKVREILDRG